jgi:hypothetical protein
LRTIHATAIADDGDVARAVEHRIPAARGDFLTSRRVTCDRGIPL